jgi:hypothetical protein
MDLAPFPNISGAVAKASTGHFPLPFLISDLKNWYKDNGIFQKSTIFVDLSLKVVVKEPKNAATGQTTSGISQSYSPLGQFLRRRRPQRRENTLLNQALMFRVGLPP